MIDARTALQQKGCILDGHFVGVSTKHLSGYCNIDPLLPDVALVNELIQQLVAPFIDANVDTVAAPAIGAIPFSHWGAHHLMQATKRPIFGVWADKVSGAPQREFIFEREGFVDHIAGKRVLILEDMINQMASIKAMIKTVQNAGGILVGVGSIAANRGVSAEALGVDRFVKLASVEYDAWLAEDCARDGLCAKSVPIIQNIGHSDDFKRSNPDYSGGYIDYVA